METNIEGMNGCTPQIKADENDPISPMTPAYISNIYDDDFNVRFPIDLWCACGK